MGEENVTYLCCPSCHGWYREGDRHACYFTGLNGKLLWGNPGVVQQFTLPPDSDRLYALLERIAVALERLDKRGEE